MKENFERVGDDVAVCGVDERVFCCGVALFAFEDAVSEMFDGREEVEDDNDDWCGLLATRVWLPRLESEAPDVS